MFNAIQKASIVLKEKYPYKLDTCYVYDAPNMFNNIFKLILLIQILLDNRYVLSNRDQFDSTLLK